MGAIRELATRAGEMRLIDLTRAGLDDAAASTLLTHSGFRPVLNAIAVAPDALPLIRNGKYFRYWRKLSARMSKTWRILQRWIRTGHFTAVASSHALAAHNEMLRLACEFRQLVQKSNTRTPAIDVLFAACEAFDPNR
jgi:hypothetical protein